MSQCCGKLLWKSCMTFHSPGIKNTLPVHLCLCQSCQMATFPPERTARRKRKAHRRRGRKSVFPYIWFLFFQGWQSWDSETEWKSTFLLKFTLPIYHSPPEIISATFLTVGVRLKYFSWTGFIRSLWIKLRKNALMPENLSKRSITSFNKLSWTKLNY